VDSSFLGDENVEKLVEAFRKGRQHDGDAEPSDEEIASFIYYWEHCAKVMSLMRATVSGYLIVNVKGGQVIAFYSNPDNPLEAQTDNPLADQIEDILQDKDWGDQ
jgi:hypothetical protein